MSTVVCFRPHSQSSDLKAEEALGLQGGRAWAKKKTGPPCYIASNFRNTAQIYTIFCRNQSRFINNTKT